MPPTPFNQKIVSSDDQTTMLQCASNCHFHWSAYNFHASEGFFFFFFYNDIFARCKCNMCIKYANRMSIHKAHGTEPP